MNKRRHLDVYGRKSDTDETAVEMDWTDLLLILTGWATAGSLSTYKILRNAGIKIKKAGFVSFRAPHPPPVARAAVTSGCPADIL